MSDNDSERDQRWLEDVFRLHHRAVLAYARRRVPSDEADDVVAEVFASTWKYRERVPDPALPWLYRTASHHVLHVHRSAGRRDRLADRAAQLQRSPIVEDHAEAVARAADDGARVRAALEHLTPRDAEILCLDAWERLDNDGLAYVLGCSRTAARVRLHRARQRFSQVLDSAAHAYVASDAHFTSEERR